MKCIGKGLQYEVFEASEDRVLKVPTTFIQKCRILLDWGCINPIKILYEAITATKTTSESISFLKKHMHLMDQALFGNPTFQPDLIYEQDRAVPIAVYFHTHTVEENKEVIDNYIQTVLRLWTFGVADSVFNFTVNNAVTESGEVIVVDLGEFVFTKREAAGLIKQKKWLRQHSFNHLCDTRLKQYFKDRAAESFTLYNLQKYWLTQTV